MICRVDPLTILGIVGTVAYVAMSAAGVTIPGVNEPTHTQGPQVVVQMTADEYVARCVEAKPPHPACGVTRRETLFTSRAAVEATTPESR